MKATESETGVLDLLAQCERVVGRLYRVYSEMFLEHQGFWLGLSAEEMMHAARIEELAGTMDPADLSLSRFNPQAVSASLEYLAARVREAEAQDLDLVAALSVALEIERAMLEHKWFEVLKTNSVEAKQTLAGLAADTRRHTLMITAVWESAKSRRDPA